MPALNDGGDLQLRQAAVLNPETQHEAADLQVAEEHELMEVEPIPSPPPQSPIPEDEPHQFPPPHRLGQMNNTCPNCGAKYFR